jgi:multisubunit Na+/H+ antiporter MnhC subunit
MKVMPTSSTVATTLGNLPLPPLSKLGERLKPYLAPYYLTVAAVLGAITVGFAVVIVLLVLVVTNFNVLGLIE